MVILPQALLVISLSTSVRSAFISRRGSTFNILQCNMAFEKNNDIMMILSPAKTLNLLPTDKLREHWTRPDCDLEKTKEVIALMKQRKKGELASLLSLSAALAHTAHEYWSTMDENLSQRPKEQFKPSIYSFSGAAYQGLQAEQCSDAAIQYMQANLRIIDPLYGILRPLDIMQPYRLEMATKQVFPDKAIRLADWWKVSITAYLSQELNLRSQKVLLNLASDEYSMAVDTEGLPEGTKYIKVVFWEDGKTIAIHAKKARGMMVRFVAEHNIHDIFDIQGFAEEGYSFVKDKSDDTTLIFNRTKQVPMKNRKSKETNSSGPAKKKVKS